VSTTSPPLSVFSRVRNASNITNYTLLEPMADISRSIGIKAKVESQDQYKQYLEQLDGLRQELGVALREELYPQEE
jgi:hypothetical protein